MARMTLLQQAAQRGNVAEIRRLVANGRNVNERDANGVAALHVAAANGSVEAMRVLVVELGADKDAKNDAGSTAMHVAAVYGQVEAIKALEQLGAQLDAQAANEDTPLKISIRAGHHQAAQVLRELERTARARTEAERTAAGRGSAETTAAASQAGACAACGSNSGASDAPL